MSTPVSIVRDEVAEWPQVGDVLEQRTVDAGKVERTFWLLADLEPVQQYRFEFEVSGPPTEEFKEYEITNLKIQTDPVKVDEEVVQKKVYYCRIGVKRGNILIKVPQLEERWGLDVEKDARRGIEAGKIFGFIDPNTSPLYDPTAWSGFWILERNQWPVLVGWNPTTSFPIKISGIIYPLLFTAVKITKEKYPDLFDKLAARLIKPRIVFLRKARAIE